MSEAGGERVERMWWSLVLEQSPTGNGGWTGLGRRGGGGEKVVAAGTGAVTNRKWWVSSGKGAARMT
jgi:hypothetical protein